MLLLDRHERTLRSGLLCFQTLPRLSPFFPVEHEFKKPRACRGGQLMTTSEFPEPGQGAAVADKPAEIAAHRARTVVLHNSRLVCWLTMGMGIISVFMGICMMLMEVSLLFPLSAITFMRVFAAIQWGLGGFLMCMMCPWLWKWGTGVGVLQRLTMSYERKTPYLAA
jgi:hypothetical protein